MINPIRTFKCLRVQIQKYHDLSGIIENRVIQQKVEDKVLQTNFEHNRTLAEKTVELLNLTKAELINSAKDKLNEISSDLHRKQPLVKERVRG